MYVATEELQIEPTAANEDLSVIHMNHIPRKQP